MDGKRKKERDKQIILIPLAITLCYSLHIYSPTFPLMTNNAKGMDLSNKDVSCEITPGYP